ncbi:hypothetical protein HID58_014642 [Brassica napus]|uniref:Uncharacterized protein n=1 Tax=Brassica napus TaxID=3708 RepID=A0ABQ8DKA6_BRANA|nr:hypothetical protein HID58_014642 [Brassica napus]
MPVVCEPLLDTKKVKTKEKRERGVCGWCIEVLFAETPLRLDIYPFVVSNSPCMVIIPSPLLLTCAYLLSLQYKVFTTRDAQARDKLTDRVRQSKSTDLASKDGSTYGSGNYVVTVGIGTPKVRFVSDLRHRKRSDVDSMQAMCSNLLFPKGTNLQSVFVFLIQQRLLLIGGMHAQLQTAFTFSTVLNSAAARTTKGFSPESPDFSASDAISSLSRCRRRQPTIRSSPTASLPPLATPDISPSDPRSY